MKIAKFFSVIFAVLGAVLMLGTVTLSLLSLNAPVRLAHVSESAVAQSEAFVEAIAGGDYTAAGNLMYGQPDLGVDREPADAAGVMIWDAFLDSICYEWKGGCYATDSGISRDAAITALDITGVTDSLPERAHTLLTQRVEAAEEMSELYDEENNFREELISDVLQEAVKQALGEDAQTVTYDVTFDLIYRDGQWWIVPNQALLQAISGGMTGR